MFSLTNSHKNFSMKRKREEEKPVIKHGLARAGLQRRKSYTDIKFYVRPSPSFLLIWNSGKA